LSALPIQRELKTAIRSGVPRLGIFVRTPAVQTVETLARSGADFLVLDAEHAPFGVTELDHCILAGRSVGIPILVRLADARPDKILQVLDMGAAGIIVPHVGSAKSVHATIDACLYDKGSRGFSGQHRAAEYGAMPGTRYRKASDESVITIAQIEDASGLENINEIAAVDDLDAVLVGRADLAVSLGCDDVLDSEVVAATDTILDAGRSAGKTTGIFLPVPQGIDAFRKRGVSLFFIATDQSLLIDAAVHVSRQFRKATGRSQ
jgi:2-keto-3-deoxy-L-rhamnonate aldolase RhmA